MNLLLDTHVLLWFFLSPEKLSRRAYALLEDVKNEVFFSSVSLFEIAIKGMKRNPEFQADARRLFREAVRHGLTELPLSAEHSLRVVQLPSMHQDPYDRLLLAQALGENLLPLTADSLLNKYRSNVLDAR